MSKCLIIGGGTFSKVACHLSLATPAFGATAKFLYSEWLRFSVQSYSPEPELILTKMADQSSSLIYNDDVSAFIDKALNDSEVKVIIMNVALCDFYMKNPSEEERLSSKEDYLCELLGVKDKILSRIKKCRPDILLVGFKTTSGDTVNQQIIKSFQMIEDSDVDFVFANDLNTRSNLLISAEKYETLVGGRELLLQTLVAKLNKKFQEVACYQYI